MSTAVIVQARIGSSRLPGKVLEPLGEKSALLRCLDRCKRITRADHVLCAVPDTEADDEIAEEAGDAGYWVVRGSESDVLSRYAKAAREAEAETVIRITSDCPFIDPVIVDKTVELFFDSGADYASNSLPAKFPHGLDCEVFPARHLFTAEREANTPAEREHVTVWIQSRADFTTAGLVGPGGGLEKLRWTLDRKEDLDFCQAVFKAMGEAAATASAAEIAALCLRRPDIAAINALWVEATRTLRPRYAHIQSERVLLSAAA